MMKSLKKVVSLALTFSLTVALAVSSVFATSNFYQYSYTDLEAVYVTSLIKEFSSATKMTDDIKSHLAELSGVNADLGERMTNILEYWDYAFNSLTVNEFSPASTTVELDGFDSYEWNHAVDNDTLVADCLSDTDWQNIKNNVDNLCLVTLGNALQSDGFLSDEGIGRTLTVYNLWNAIYEKTGKYVMIAVTGGGTAKQNSSVTEGGQMSAYLQKLGVPAEYIIVEDQAGNTAGNAVNTMKILNESYPNITKLWMLTSDYHINRGSTFFNTAAQFYALDTGKEYEIIGNLGYSTGKSKESIGLYTSQMYSIADTGYSSSVASKLLSAENLTIDQESVKVYQGQDLDVNASLNFESTTNTLSVDVSDYVTTDFDNTKVGNQTVTVSLTYLGVTYSATLDVEVLAFSLTDEDGNNVTGITVDSIDELVIGQTTAADLGITVNVGSATKNAVLTAYDPLTSIATFTVYDDDNTTVLKTFDVNVTVAQEEDSNKEIEVTTEQGSSQTPTTSTAESNSTTESPSDTVKTSDNTNVIATIVSMCLSGAVLGVYELKKRKYS